MKSFDEYLSQEQYKHDDRPLNDDKVWVLVTDGEFVEASADEVWIRESLYNERKHYSTIGWLIEKIELGWVYQNDFDPMNFEYTYRLLNVVETYKK